jgi:hypothetical protein
LQGKSRKEAVRPLSRRAVLTGLAGAAAALASSETARAQRPQVRVTREEPVVVRHEFNPRRPPADMPPLTPPESGVCKATFELAASLSYSAERLSATAARIYVDAVDIVTRLRFDIYVIENAPAKLRAHEEAHRMIGEHFYRDAATIAEGIGRRLIGRTFDGTGANQEAARRTAFDKAVAEIETAYMARVRIPSAAANERFDELTRHGLDPIDEAEAVALALGPSR